MDKDAAYHLDLEVVSQNLANCSIYHSLLDFFWFVKEIIWPYVQHDLPVLFLMGLKTHITRETIVYSFEPIELRTLVKHHWYE